MQFRGERRRRRVAVVVVVGQRNELQAVRRVKRDGPGRNATNVEDTDDPDGRVRITATRSRRKVSSTMIRIPHVFCTSVGTRNDHSRLLPKGSDRLAHSPPWQLWRSPPRARRQ
eukprot:TRINITY_DN20369_c0_g1_i1.p3 TRINITY_DN20369_c0_g1~~TRINITY_DN20369_c0_g1_i1.p3  ORF type:complete len:114 (-),score=1.63 TRINITY_DN20369_c0_g1_i1:252-593(-)